jgi:membrane associated rhomboid family serine protease
VVFLFGLLLAPVGAAIGAVILCAVIILISASTSPIRPSEWFDIVLFGTGIGMTAALPTTGLVLPVAYLIIRRRSAATPAKLAATGALAGFVISGWSMIGFWDPDMTDPRSWAIVGGIAADGAIAGAFCGMALGMIMRRTRPQTQAASPP